MTRRVFIVSSDARYQTHAAEEFGERVFLNINESAFAADLYSEAISEVLDDNGFNPDSDYVAVTGPLIEVTLLISVVFGRFRRGNLLMFSATAGKYRCRPLDVGAIVYDR